MQHHNRVQAVIGQPITAEARVQSQDSPCGICRGQSDTGTGFAPSTSFSRVDITHPMLRIYSFIYHEHK
jgi:hypothetical protein